MANLWGRSPRNRLGRDMQALVYLDSDNRSCRLFNISPFFNDIFSRMSVPAADTVISLRSTLPDLNNSGYVNSQIM